MRALQELGARLFRAGIAFEGLGERERPLRDPPHDLVLLPLEQQLDGKVEQQVVSEERLDIGLPLAVLPARDVRIVPEVEEVGEVSLREARLLAVHAEVVVVDDHGVTC